MWGFFILCLQAMIIVAWNGSGNPSANFNGDVFKKVLSVFITAAILKLGQATLDVILSWKEREGELEKRELTTISSFLFPLFCFYIPRCVALIRSFSMTMRKELNEHDGVCNL
ncbi:callose synthase 1-like [Arachis ipaensis]|uniref:callose synthase 1-like n=1 Tax=Arachis ipaensis TaxID=130454 RepID=UPI000A2B641D|nr:callose synthase 1-like [Arachis ipaensis]